MIKNINYMKDSIRIILILIITIWVVEIINIVTHRFFLQYGILPRSIDGIFGIILHPFIHGSIQHIMSNSIPLFVLGFIVAIEGKFEFFKITLFIIIVGGFLLWLFGRNSYHIGASLLIFGYFGFVIVNAFHKKTASSIFAALITIFLYGGLIYGLIPVNSHISWEGHLFGLIAGIMAVKVFRK